MMLLCAGMGLAQDSETTEPVLPANPDVIALADVATLSGAEQAGLLEWARAGGIFSPKSTQSAA